MRAGLVPYEDAWARQRELHAARVAGEGPDTLLLLEHPPVYTAGKRTEPHERPFDGTPVIDVDRGGKITWHGPGQLVGYPIVALPDPVDVVAYVRRLEDALIEVCAGFGLADRPGRGPQRRVGARRRAGRRVPARAQGRRDRRPGRPRRDHARLRAQLRPRHDGVRQHDPVRHPRRRRHVAVGRAGPRHPRRRGDRAGRGGDAPRPRVRAAQPRPDDTAPPQHVRQPHHVPADRRRRSPPRSGPLPTAIR